MRKLGIEGHMLISRPFYDCFGLKLNRNMRKDHQKAHKFYSKVQERHITSLDNCYDFMDRIGNSCQTKV